tara:strand:+ start:22931 stop:26086 length:3156 start_codon:yes stop_codon:yes gene_type:complete
MGVKVKTPTPFIGAGQIGTVTPNLSGMGSAIAGVADDLLKTRFEERALRADEQGTTDGSNFITYNDKGDLQNLGNLPEGDTFYDQAFKKSAKITYLNALQTDVQKFSAQFLLESPDDPNLVSEKMDILFENTMEDMAPELKANALLTLNKSKNVAVATAQNNKIINEKRIANDNATFTLTEGVIDSFEGASLRNEELNPLTIKTWEDAIDVKIATKQDNYTEKTKPEILKKLIEMHGMHKKLFKFNQLLELYDPMKEGSNYESQVNIQKYKDEILESLDDQSQRKEWLALTTTTYQNKKLGWDKLVVEKNAQKLFNQKIAFEKETEIISQYKPEDFIIPPEERGDKKADLIKKMGPITGMAFWNANFQGRNLTADKAEIKLDNDYILLNVLNKAEGYNNPKDIEARHPNVFNNEYYGSDMLFKLNKHFIEEHNKRLDRIDVWNIDKFTDEIINGSLMQDGTNYHWSKSQTEVKENVKNFLKTRYKLTEDDIKPSVINSIIDKWVVARNDVMEHMTYQTEALHAINNKQVLKGKVFEWLKEATGDNKINPSQLQGGEVLQQMKQMNIYNSVDTAFGNYLVSAVGFDASSLEKIMPGLDYLFNNSNKGEIIQMQKRLEKKGVDVRFLRDFYKSYKNNQNNAELGMKYALSQKENEDNTNRKNSAYFGTFLEIGKNNPFVTNIKVTDEDSLQTYMSEVWNDTLLSNKGFLDAWLGEQIAGANFNDARVRPIVKMMDKIKSDFGVSFNELEQSMPQEIWDNVSDSVRMVYENNPIGYQNSPKLMNNVIVEAITTELGSWFPVKDINIDGDTDSPPTITWSKQSIIYDAQTSGGWNAGGWDLNEEIISAEIGFKMANSGIEIPSFTPAEEIGLQLTDEKYAKSWLDVDFSTQFAYQDDNGQNRYSIWYTDQYGNKVQVMADNGNDTQSPLYFDYNYSNSLAFTASKMVRENSRNVTPHGSLIAKIWDSISAKGLSGSDLETNKDIEYLGRLIPNILDDGNIGAMYKEMLKNKASSDNKEHNEEWMKNNLGSFISGGGKLAVNMFENAGIDIFNYGK